MKSMTVEKRVLTVFLTLLLLIGLAGCNGITQEEHAAVLAQRDELQAEQSSLSQEYADLQTQYQEISDKYDKLQKEYDQYKEETADFTKMTEEQRAQAVAQAELDRINKEEEARQAKEAAEKAEAERKAQEEAEKEAAEQARLAEEAKGYETGITYEQLARSPEKYKNQKVKFTGEVIQVIEPSSGSTVTLRINVTKGSYGIWKDTVYATVNLPKSEDRILEDDIITFYGVSVGMISYESTLGATISIPGVRIDRFEFQ